MTTVESTRQPAAGTPVGERSDAQLIAAVRAGDKDAYGQLYARHQAAAHRAASYYVRSTADREDVVQVAFAEVLATMGRGGGPQEAFRPYLLTCVRRIGGRHAATRSAEGAASAGLAEAEELPGRGLRPDERLDHILVTDAFEELPERWRLVLWHSVVEDEDLATVGSLVGLSSSAAGQLLRRAKEGLRVAFLAGHIGRETAGEPGCSISPAQLAAYTRGNLSAAAMARIDSHVATCPRCSGRITELHGVEQAMRSVVAPAVLGMPMATYLSGRGAALAGLSLRTVATSWWGRVAAGVLVIGVGAGAWLATRPGSEPLPDTQAGRAVVTTAGADADGTALAAPSGTGAASDVAVAPTLEPQETSAAPQEVAASAAVGAGGAWIAPVSAPHYNPGDTGALRIEADSGAGGIFDITLPQDTAIISAQVQAVCDVTGPRTLTCPASGSQAILDLPITIEPDIARGQTLGGGSVTLQTTAGTVVGPVPLSVVVPQTPC